jgi:hypothetical protein
MNFKAVKILNSSKIRSENVYVCKKQCDGEDEYSCQVCEGICFSQMELYFHDKSVLHKKNYDDKLNNDMLNLEVSSYRMLNCNERISLLKNLN